MRPDEFAPEIYLSDWVFTVALGAGVGLVLAGPLMLALGRGRLSGLLLLVSGVVLTALVSTLALDAAPWDTLDFQLKPYLAVVAETAVMAGALALGAAGTLLAVLAGDQLSRRRGLPRVVPIAAALTGATAVAVVSLLLLETVARAPRHPEGTDTSNPHPIRVVVGELEVPSGLAVAANGDLAVVELNRNRLLLFEPAGDGYELVDEFALGLPQRSLAFHTAFHPAYPEQPAIFVTVRRVEGESSTLEVLQVSTTDGRIERMIGGLPIAQGGRTNHYGGAIAICGDSLFVSTSDTDSLDGTKEPGTRRHAERVLAQQPDSGAGQVMRWTLTGDTIAGDGVFGNVFPSFAMGLRNPYAMTCDAATGYVWVADNGEEGFDQLRLVEPGSNHGWPATSERIVPTAPWFDMKDARVAPSGLASRPGDTDQLVMSGFVSGGVYEWTLDRDARTVAAIRLLADVPGGAFAVAIDHEGCVLVSGGIELYRVLEPGCE
mgnify:CR=1 FL=1